MATVGPSEKLPLYVNFGVHGAITLFFSVWLMFRITIWKLGKPLSDLTSQSMLYWGLTANFLQLVISLSLFYNQFPFQRWDSVVIQYSHWLAWAAVFAVLSRMLTVFLSMNRVWTDSLFYTFAGSALSLFIAAFIGDTSRYLFFAVHFVIHIYAIHCLWVYRERSDFHAIFILAVVSVAWVVGYSVPFLLGHSALQVISFTFELWWYSIAGWIMIGFTSLYLARNVHRLGKELEDFLTNGRYKFFSTRLSRSSIPGECYFNFVYLPTTQDKREQAAALESGHGQRTPKAVLVPSGGERSAVVMEESQEEEFDEFGMHIGDSMDEGRHFQTPSPPSPPTVTNSKYPNLYDLHVQSASKRD